MKENKCIAANRAMHGVIEHGQGRLIMAKSLFRPVFMNRVSIDFHICHDGTNFVTKGFIT